MGNTVGGGAEVRAAGDAGTRGTKSHRGRGSRLVFTEEGAGGDLQPALGDAKIRWEVRTTVERKGSG